MQRSPSGDYTVSLFQVAGAPGQDPQRLALPPANAPAPAPEGANGPGAEAYGPGYSPGTDFANGFGCALQPCCTCPLHVPARCPSDAVIAGSCAAGFISC